jgi:hypothetical protein
VLRRHLAGPAGDRSIAPGGDGIGDAVVSTAMRRAVIHIACLGISAAACAGKPSPTVIPRIDSLPGEHVAREQRLESTAARPGPEHTKGKTRKWQQVETTAATAAAILGSIFSTTKTVTVGVSAPIDENEIVDPGYRDRAGRKPDEAPAPETYDPNQLTPWVQLGGGRGP